MAAPTGKGTPTDDHSRRPETLQGRQWKGGPRGGEVEKGARAIGGKNPPSQHSVLPTYDEGDDSAGVDDGKNRRSHPGRGPRGGGPRHRALLRSKFVINPDPTPVVKLKIPKKPGPQKSLQEVAAARATENLRRDKKGKVREQVDLFVVAQKAQVVLCYHKKGRQKENL